MKSVRQISLLVLGFFGSAAALLTEGLGQEAKRQPTDIGSEISQLEQKRASDYAFCLRLLVQKKDYAQGAELAARALIIPPEDAADKSKLRNLIQDVALGLLQVEKAPGKAADLCEKAAEKLGEHPVLYYIAGLAYEELGDETKRDEWKEKAETIKSDDQAFWFEVASYLQEKAALESALEAYEKVAAISSDAPTHYNADSVESMASIYCRLGDYEKALRRCENLREIARKIIVSRTDIVSLTAMVYAEKAREEEVEGKYEQAIEDYKKSAELAPQPGGAWIAIGELYVKLKSYDEAEQWFRKALDAGGSPIGHAGLGDVLKARGRLKEAHNEYEKCERAFADRIESDPDIPSNYNNLAWFYATHNMKLDKAVELAKKALDLDPDSAEYLDTLAELYYLKGDREAAVREINKALALDPPHIKYYQKQLEKFQKEVP